MAGPATPRWITGALCLPPSEGGWLPERRDIEIADGRIAALHPPGPLRDGPQIDGAAAFG